MADAPRESSQQRLHPHTALVHGEDPYHANAVRASTPPIYLSSTFSSQHATSFGEYNYSRSANPTRDALEAKLAALDAAQSAISQDSQQASRLAYVRSLACASGVTALNTLLTVLAPGDEVLCSQDVYGGTFRLFSDAWQQRGIIVTYVDATNAEAVQQAWSQKTKLLHIEPVGNPLMSVCDIALLATIAHERGGLLSVDNTSLTSLHCKPLVLGADIAIQSATKYLCGHGDVTSGVVSLRDEQLAKRFAFHHNAEGSALAPFDCYMLHRGMESLAPRMYWQERTAQNLAKRLQTIPGITRVRHPSLLTARDARVHSAQSSGHGAVISFETGNEERSKHIVEALKLFAIRVSFGSVTSSASMPIFMSHRAIPAALASLRPPTDLIRLSIGLEHEEDLWKDIEQACAKG